MKPGRKIAYEIYWWGWRNRSFKYARTTDGTHQLDLGLWSIDWTFGQ